MPEYTEIKREQEDIWSNLNFCKKYWVYIFFIIIEILLIIYYALHSEFAFDERKTPPIVGVLVANDHI